MITVDFTTENGQTYPVAFTSGAFIRFSQKIGKEAFVALSEIESSGMEMMAEFVCIGLEVGAKLSGTPKSFDVLDIADQMTVNDLTSCIALVSHFMPPQQPQQGEAEAGTPAALPSGN